MPNRKPSNPSTHDKLVRQESDKLKQAGWKVQADIAGFDKPDPVGKDNRIPDIQATKGGRVQLLEVETPKTLIQDKKQQETFRRSAAQKKNTTFKVIKTK